MKNPHEFFVFVVFFFSFDRKKFSVGISSDLSMLFFRTWHKNCSHDILTISMIFSCHENNFLPHFAGIFLLLLQIFSWHFFATISMLNLQIHLNEKKKKLQNFPVLTFFTLLLRLCSLAESYVAMPHFSSHFSPSIFRTIAQKTISPRFSQCKR